VQRWSRGRGFSRDGSRSRLEPLLRRWL